MKTHREQYKNVTGMLSNFDCNEIVNLANDFSENTKVLEIGSFLGKSTVAWLDGLNSKCKLDVMDMFDKTAETIKYDIHINNLKVKNNEILKMIENGSNQLDIWHLHTSAHPNSSIIKNVYTIDSKKYIEEDMGNDYDCVFLDANHTYDHVAQQLEYFKNVDVICGDDYNNETFPGVVKAVDEFANENNRNFELHKNFYVLRKIPVS